MTQVKELRKAANKFLLQVHPDFFRDRPKIAKTNETSLSELNAFIDIVEQNSSRKYFRLIKSRVPDVVKVKFWMKAADDQLQTVRADYRFPPHFFTQDVETAELEQEAVFYINSLLSQAGISAVGIEDIKTRRVDKEVPDDQAEENQPKKKKSLHDRLGPAEKDPLRKAMIKQLDPEFNMMLWKARFAEDTIKSVGDVLLPEDSPWMEMETQIFYAPSLTSTQRGEVLRDLRHNYDTLRHDLWSDIPIMFTNNNTYLRPDQLPGFLTIPHNFDLQELSDYIDVSLPEIRNQRRAIREQIITIRYYQQQLATAFRLGEIKFTGGSRTQVVEALIRMSHMADELEPFHLQSLTLDLSTKFTKFEFHPDRNLIEIPLPFDEHGFTSFLSKTEDDLRIHFKESTFTLVHQQRLAKISKSMAVHLGVKQVLISHSLSQSQFLQFVGMFNLKRHIEIFKKLGLEGVVLVIGTRFELDRKHKRITVPFEFSNQELVNFLSHKLQEKIKK